MIRMDTTWPNNATFWRNQRVTVTGRRRVPRLLCSGETAGAGSAPLPPNSGGDLVQRDAVLALLHDARPDLIIHLSARVGGIGANLIHQAEYFYENLMMGTQLLHEAYVAGVPKFVAVGAICGYPKFAPIPFREEDLWNGYPGQACATWQTTCG